jgi:DNA invertase Pin-like site-specific DNA recombinase
LDRLGRSLCDLANITHEVEQAGAHLRVIEQNVDTSSAAGCALFGMLAVFAAFETDVRREPQLEVSRWQSARVPMGVGRRALIASASGSLPTTASGQRQLPQS